MDYQIWTKDDYDDKWARQDCGDLAAAKRIIDTEVRAGREPLLTVEVPYKIDIKFTEVSSEVTKSKTKSDKGAGGKGDGPIRRGDETVTEGLDKGSGDSGAGAGAGD